MSKFSTNDNFYIRAARSANELINLLMNAQWWMRNDTKFWLSCLDCETMNDFSDVAMTEASTVDVTNDNGDSSNGGTDDENLTGFQYMKKYYKNTSPYRRQQIAKNIIQIFGAEMCNRVNEDEIFVVYDAFVNDKDTAVRTDIMEQSGKLASFLYAVTLSEQLSYYSEYISVHILSSIYKLLLDPASQVRKASRMALILLIENKVLSEEQIIKDVLPLVENVLDTQNIDDLRAEAVTLLVRLACICGQKTTLEHFIHKFVSLCRDPIFSVRKTCALSLPDIINVVGPEATESLLLPELPHLVNDSVWGVRKICAESFTVFSENVSGRTRREVLSPLYLTCFNDDSRWVKIAAFQNLGKFIATFADVLSSGVSLAQGDLDSDCPEVILHPEILAKMKRANEDTSLQLRWASNVFWNVPPPQVFDLDLEDPVFDDIQHQTSPIFSRHDKVDLFRCQHFARWTKFAIFRSHSWIASNPSHWNWFSFSAHISWRRKITICVAFFSKFCQISSEVLIRFNYLTVLHSYLTILVTSK